MISSIRLGYGKTGKLMPMNLENKHGKGKNDTLCLRLMVKASLYPMIDQRSEACLTVGRDGAKNFEYQIYA
jgi:hypothetical protein